MARQSVNHDILVAEEVADMFRMDRQTVVRYAKRGKIPGKMIGYVWRFSRAEIEKMIPGSVESASRGEDGSDAAVPSGTDREAAN